MAKDNKTKVAKLPTNGGVEDKDQPSAEDLAKEQADRQERIERATEASQGR